jgi:hypothetical protein
VVGWYFFISDGVGRGSRGVEGRPTGRIAFDENGDVVNRGVVIGVVRNRKLVTAQ